MPVPDPEFDNAQAGKEGWGVFECLGSENGDFQICRCDEEEVFPTDDEAWAHVVARAHEGSAYHRAALDYIKKHNPIEWVAFHGCHGEDLIYPDGAPMVGDDGVILQEDGLPFLDSQERPIQRREESAEATPGFAGPGL